jgi:hypothetical protein
MYRDRESIGYRACIGIGYWESIEYRACIGIGYWESIGYRALGILGEYRV